MVPKQLQVTDHIATPLIHHTQHQCILYTIVINLMEERILPSSPDGL